MGIHPKITHARCRAAAFILSLGLCGAASAQSAADIQAALETASPGDVIEVAAGDYGLVEITGESFAPAVTLRFLDGAEVKKMRIRHSTGLVFENLNIEAGPSLDPLRENAVVVFSGGDITFRNSYFAWAKDGDPLNDGTALSVDGVEGLNIISNHFSDTREALIVRASTDVVIADSHFTDILEDGIVIAGSVNVLIDHNICTDFRAAVDPQSHPDCIQLQSGGRAVANTNVMISNNTIQQGDGDRAQPIFVNSRHAGVPHIGVTIENNTTRQSTAIGIHVGNTHDLIIRGNRVLPSPQSVEPPRILARSDTQNVLIEGNTAARVRGPAGAVIRDNVTP